MTDDQRDIDLTLEEAQALMDEGEPVELIASPYVSFGVRASIIVNDLRIGESEPMNLGVQENISVTA